MNESTERRRLTRRVGLALLAGAGATAMVAAVVAFSVGYGTTVGANVLVNKGQVIDANNSPAVARNPRRPQNLVVVQRIDSPSFSALLEASFDGGATWATQSLPLPEGADRPFAPDVAFGPDGTLYVLYVNLEGVGNTPANLWLATSHDGGRTLSNPAHVAGKLCFQARLAVDRRGTIYLTWLQASAVGLFSLGASPAPLVSARSTDGGHSFSPPSPISDPGRTRVGAATPTVDSAGRLVVLYEDFKRDARDFENLDGPPAEDPFALVVTRSDDGGQSFSPGVELDAGVVATGRFVAFLPPFPSLAAGPGSALYVTWADGRDGQDSVMLRRSTDGGTTWSPRVRVRGGDGSSLALPRAAVAANGRVDVLFLERRPQPTTASTPNNNTNAYVASSGDGGRTFGARRVSSQAFDSGIGVGTPHGGPDFGTRLALDDHGNQTFAAWTDTRLGTRETGRQDIAGVVIRHLPVWPIVVWPVLAGLVVLGGLGNISRRLAATRSLAKGFAEEVPASADP